MKPEVSHPTYRPDIDGLRAVAVLSVVGFHAFPGWFRGGFVGVDVFFVISGYLISKIIIGNLDANRFSFTEFYARRVRRIFPALAVVLGGCIVIGWFVLLPNEYSQLGKHIAGGAGFVSNFVLLGEAGYFDTTTVTKPLLHLWSLGIEEQFYICWPVMLYLARKRIRLLVLAILAGSFILNLLFLPRYPIATFYNPVTRFWELLLGSTLADLALHQPSWLAEGKPHGRELASLSGFALIGVAVLMFNADQPFPGWRGLLPTVGAVLVISAGADAWVNRHVLANRLMVSVGLISFPLYLWHWPLLSFARIVKAATPSPQLRVAAVILSIVLAALTFRFVERPIRAGLRKRWTIPLLLSSVALLLASGLVVLWAKGFAAARGPWNVTNISEAYSKKDQFTEACRRSEAEHFEPRFDPETDFCHSTSDTSAHFDIVVVGDSHAGRIYSGLLAAGLPSVLNLGRGSCLPFIDYEASNPGKDAVFGCSPTMGHLIERAIDSASRVVVLSGFFARPYDGEVTLRTTKPLKVYMHDTLARLAATVGRVMVVLDVPELPFDPSYCVERPFNKGAGRGRCAFSRAEPDKKLALYDTALRGAAQDFVNVSFFDPAAALCDADNCFAVKDEHLLYDDRHHLSRYGALLVGQQLAPRIQ